MNLLDATIRWTSPLALAGVLSGCGVAPPERDASLPETTPLTDTLPPQDRPMEVVRDVDRDVSRDAGFDTGNDTSFIPPDVPGDLPGDVSTGIRLSSLRVERFATLPCGDAPVDIVAAGGLIYVACPVSGSMRNQLYFFDPADAARPARVTLRSDIYDPAEPPYTGAFGRVLNTVVPFSSTQAIGTLPDGFYIFNLVASGTTRFVSLSTHGPYDTVGGALVVGGSTVYIASSNIAPARFPATYRTGTVHEFSLLSELPSTGSERRYTGARYVRTIPLQVGSTIYRNPTAIGSSPTIPGPVVLSSGPVVGSPKRAETPALVLLSPTGIIERVVPFDGRFTASLSGHLAMAPDGDVVVGSSSNTQRIQVLNPRSGARYSFNIPGAFHSVTLGDRGEVYVPSFEGVLTVIADRHGNGPANQRTMTLGESATGPGTYFRGSYYQTYARGVLRVYSE